MTTPTRFPRFSGPCAVSAVFTALLVGALLTGVCTEAFAARAGSFSVLRFRPLPSPLSLYHTDVARPLGHLTPAFGMYLHYDHRPLVFVDANSGERQYDEISFQANAQFTAAIGLFDRFEIGIALPVGLLQGVGDRPDKFPSVPDIGGGFGDMRLFIKARLFHNGPFDVAVFAPILLPTGNADNYLGDGGIGFEPKLAASWDIGRFGAAVNFGYRVRPDRSFQPALTNQDINVDDEVSITAGGRVGLLVDKLDLVVDYSGTMNTSGGNDVERGGEVLGGLRFYLPHGLIANLAAGPGIGAGMGVPQLRVIAHIAWMPVADTDRDGLKDPDDKCPTEPEDKDGFEDEDGCPDPDNDKDGIPDTNDKCPDEPEDKDGWQDEDGCPDPDNDGDGFKDADDKCPNEAEDKDGFEDDDGCPDLDNDKDGIPDTKDKCPLQPEDKDGWQDDDGCPDPDNDKDGIPDVKDKCPNDPEAFNNYKDDDGCPDEAPKAKVKIVKEEIKVPPVFFASNKDEILAKSFANLDLVAHLLNMNKWVKKVEIQGHTDDVGQDKANLDLSQRRAASVVKFLVDKGVATDRLVAKGYGETAPKCTDVPALLKKGRRGKRKLASCRGENRRVAFIIIDPKAEGDGTAATRTRKVTEEIPGRDLPAANTSKGGKKPVNPAKKP